MRIQELYILDRAVMKLAPAARSALRDEKVRPAMEAFFTWAKSVHDEEAPRSRATQALGYALRQRNELMAVLANPEVPLDNTRAERNLRKIVIGRKNWLFYGSDCHAEAAAALFSLIATCRLHGLEPATYFDEVLRVLPYWPSDRYLELAPHHWQGTRSKLNPAELAKPISRITVPAA